MTNAMSPNARRACAAGLITLCLATLSPAPAAAQDVSAPPGGREAQLDAARARKAEALQPPVRSRIERALLRYDEQGGVSILPTWRGFHFAGGEMPAGAGTKVGVGFDHGFGGRPTWIDRTASSSRRGPPTARAATSRRASGLAVTNLANRPLDLRLRGQAYEYPEEDFFGLGIDSAETDRSAYLLRGVEADASLLWRPAKLRRARRRRRLRRPRTGAGTDPRFPSTTDRPTPPRLPASTRARTTCTWTVGAALDWRDNPLYPHAGGRYGVRVARYGGSRRGHRRVPPRRRRAAAVRAAPESLPHAGAARRRGADRRRRRRSGPVLLPAHARRPPDAPRLPRVPLPRPEQPGVDGGVSLGGVVGARRGAVRRRGNGRRRAPRPVAEGSQDVTYGVGFRLHSNRAFIARLDLAYSREGFIPLLRFEHVF